jgi:hypothetical protein
MNKKQKNGISLIVLVITIIVIIILAGSVILSLSANNPIVQASEAKFKTNANEYNSELTLAIAKNYSLGITSTFDPSSINLRAWNGVEAVTGTIKELITSISAADGPKYEIQAGKLVYVGSVVAEQGYITSMGLKNKTALGVGSIAADNATVNGLIASYNNPTVPKGFKAVNTTDASWANVSTDWNKGLVIEDAFLNQFVWVPLDGVNVSLTRYYGVRVGTDPVPSDFSTTAVTNIYKGFYVARYEAMFDYNSGSIRAASRKGTNTTITDWKSSRDNAHSGYLWNWITYDDCKLYAESMDTAYGYDTTKIGTNLITGTQYDALVKWMENSGVLVGNAATWGNVNYAVSPANILGFGNLQASGFSELWKAKNIYDVAGNSFDITSEVDTNGYERVRGDSYVWDDTLYPPNFTDVLSTPVAGVNKSFRIALYIK